MAVTRKKAVKPKKLSKEKKASLIDGKIDDLMKARQKHGTAIIEWESAHAHASELKKTMELRQCQVNGLVADIADIRSGNYTPPLPFTDDKAKPDKPETPSTLRADGPWKAVELSTLINGAILKSLHEADIKTVGDLHNYTATNKRLQDIKGIGPGKGQKIEDALLDFWQKNPQFADPPAAEAKPVESGS